MKKICSKCRETLLISEFPKSSTGKHGVHSWCKSCHREYGKQNKNKRYENVKTYKARHPDRVKESLKTNYQNNRNNKLKYAKEYRNNNKELVSANNKKWRESNPDRQKELQKSWRDSHKEEIRQHNHHRRFLLGGNGGTYSIKEWNLLCQRFDNKCLCCKRKNVLLTVDHVIPLVKGGTNAIDNLQPLCGSCNSRKKDKIIDYRIGYFYES